MDESVLSQSFFNSLVFERAASWNGNRYTHYFVFDKSVTSDKGKKNSGFFFLIEPHIIVYLFHLSELKKELIKVLIKFISEGGL